MDNVVIQIENVGKLYRLGQIGTGTLTRDLNRWWHTVRKKEDPYSKIGTNRRLPLNGKDERVWVLRNISFSVKQGEIVGIIGRNGAGKSTLLKILSRITAPTEGRIRISGQVASLLEIGTGFHPELTGKDNIYLNGAILGMSRKDISSRYEAIVEFSELAQFINTPVKRYSSGMYVRLAFAVAAHLNPEILVVDEVLAVGDAAFQKKCIGKMSDVAKDGRTVLFVSHQMMAVQQLCQRGIVLHGGEKVFDGPVDGAITKYGTLSASVVRNDLEQRTDRQGMQRVTFTRVIMHDGTGVELGTIRSGQDVCIRCEYVSEYVRESASVVVSLKLKNSYGVVLANLNSADTGFEILPIYRSGAFECVWKRVNVAKGIYTSNLYLSVNNIVEDWIEDAFTFDVESGDYFRSGKNVYSNQGVLLVDHSWASLPQE